MAGSGTREDLKDVKRARVNWRAITKRIQKRIDKMPPSALYMFVLIGIGAPVPQFVRFEWVPCSSWPQLWTYLQGFCLPFSAPSHHHQTSESIETRLMSIRNGTMTYFGMYLKFYRTSPDDYVCLIVRTRPRTVRLKFEVSSQSFDIGKPFIVWSAGKLEPVWFDSALHIHS